MKTPIGIIAVLLTLTPVQAHTPGHTLITGPNHCTALQTFAGNFPNNTYGVAPPGIPIPLGEYIVYAKADLKVLGGWRTMPIEADIRISSVNNTSDRYPVPTVVGVHRVWCQQNSNELEIPLKGSWAVDWLPSRQFYGTVVEPQLLQMSYVDGDVIIFTAYRLDGGLLSTLRWRGQLVQMTTAPEQEAPSEAGELERVE